MTRMERLRRLAPKGLAALFIGSGTLHLLRPGVFARAVPAALPAPGAIIAMSGIAELLCGAGLVAGSRRAGRISAILLLAIFPGNVSMALRAAAGPTSSRLARAALWARLPLQLPLIWAALQAGKSQAPRPNRHFRPTATVPWTPPGAESERLSVDPPR